MKKTLLLLLMTLNLIFGLIVCSPIGYLICVMFYLIYISRIERGLNDIQISTYYKLIEIGLGKHLNISIG